MFVLKIAQVIQDYLSVVFLYVLSIYRFDDPKPLDNSFRHWCPSRPAPFCIVLYCAPDEQYCTALHCIIQLQFSLIIKQYELRHDETNKMSVRPAKTQISLGFRPVWSDFSLCVQWVAKDPRFFHADSEDFDQTGRTLLVLSCRGSIIYN